MSEIRTRQFFLGANTPQGFVSLFDELEPSDQPWHTFLIKGGPGTGKSSFLKRIASAFAPSSPDMEVIPCSSDPDSLDAVILPSRHISLADATAPHVLEPSVPAVRQTLLSFGDHLDAAELQKHRAEIEAASTAIPKSYDLAIDYLRAAQSFLLHRRLVALRAADHEKILGYARRFAAKNFSKGGGALPGKEQFRFLTAIHADGFASLEETPAQLCRRIYVIEDDCGAVSHLLLSALRTHAMEMGHSVITCMCPMDPFRKIDHLLIPSAGVAFLTSNRYHTMEGAGNAHRIHAKRFLDQEALRTSRLRLSFDRKAARELMEQAIVMLKECRTLHDQLESRYAAAMDFQALEERYPKILDSILDFSYHQTK